MPTNTERLDNLEKRVTAIEHPKWTAWLPVGAPIVTFIVVIVTLGIHLDNKIGTAQKDLQGISTRLKGVEDAVKVLGNQQSDQTQKLINSLLAAAKLAQKPEIAAKATAVAASLTAALRQEKRAASPEFFKATALELTSLHRSDVKEVRLGAFRTQQELAEYQSALQLGKTIGFVINCSPESKLKSAIGPGGISDKADRLVSGITITNCPQILDGFLWKNVVFINDRIIYHGGPVILDNVTFVNCKFEAEVGDEGFELLQYTALDQRSLRIKPEKIPG